MIKMIAAMDEARGIGTKNHLLYKSKVDMNFFKEKTINGVVVMGYNTMKSLPKKGLPRRTNVLFCDKHKKDPQFRTMKQMYFREVLEYAKHNDIWIIGGAATYDKFLPHAEEIYLTIFKGIDERADTFFPPFELFYEEVSSEPFKDENVEGMFVKYVQRKDILQEDEHD